MPVDTGPEEKRLLFRDVESGITGGKILSAWRKIETPSETESSTNHRIINLQCILLNTFSTVTIVFMNKIVFSEPQLVRCQMSIVTWHFFVTGLVLYIATCWPFNIFRAVRLPLSQMLPISIFFASFLLLQNLSLVYNTVDFYQVAKVMTTPTVVLLNFILFGRTISRMMLLSVTCVCVGVVLTETTLALSNPFGMAIATAAFTVTALYQIWIGKEMSDLEVSAPQLLLNQAPVSVLLISCLIPFLDTMPDYKILYTLFGSGILASLLNLSQFLIIERTSTLTFNIVSHLKTIMIVALGWFTEGRIIGIQDVLGICLALGGAYAFAQLSRK